MNVRVCVCVCGLSEGADWLQPPTQKFKGRLPSVPVGSPLSARLTTCLLSSRCVLNKTLRRGGLMFMLSQGFPEAQVVTVLLQHFWPRRVKLSCIDLLVHHHHGVELSFPRPQWTCSWLGLSRGHPASKMAPVSSCQCGQPVTSTHHLFKQECVANQYSSMSVQEI